MKVMVIVKANADSEAGRMPSQQELSEMGAFNEQLVAAGIMLAIMTLPIVTAVSRDVFLAVPRAQREAMLALGATLIALTLAIWPRRKSCTMPSRSAAASHSAALAISAALGVAAPGGLRRVAGRALQLADVLGEVDGLAHASIMAARGGPA